MSMLPKKILKCKKGTSLVEVIVALAILGIISTVATMSFVSSMQTSNKSKEQIELNAVIDTITENVTNAVKCPDSSILGNPGKKLVISGGASYSLTTNCGALQVMDGSGNFNNSYQFDIEQAFGEPTSITQDTVLKYLITLKKQDGTELRKFRLEINTLDFDNNVP